MTDIHEKVEIVSTDDEKVKLIGGLLSNDTSRNILKLLFEQEMTANEIAQKTGMLLSLVIFHLQKMQEADLIKINKIGKNIKGHDMKYYGATKLAVIIMPSKISEKAKKSKSLFNSLNRIYKFAAIGLAGLATWLMIHFQNLDEEPTHGGIVPPLNEITTNTFVIIVPLIVVLVGLIIERIILEIKK
ncbi:MAG: winged helix-turn-helix domain-containing protein [Candidatus Nitrosotenuis sp.]